MSFPFLGANGIGNAIISGASKLSGLNNGSGNGGGGSAAAPGSSAGNAIPDSAFEALTDSIRNEMEFNATQADKEREFNSAQSLLARQFNAREAAKARIFNSLEAAKARAFNSREARLQREYEERLSNTAYSRAVSDMRANGLNPYLMFGSASPASTPSGSAASGAALSGSAASGSALGSTSARTNTGMATANLLSSAINSAAKLLDSFIPSKSSKFTYIFKR